jgi:hypothetical protein
MTDAEAIEALNDSIDNPDAHVHEEQRGAARSALLVLRKSLDDGPIREPLTDITGCDY